MIIGPDFIWLHFPKCAGTTLELALRDLLKGRPAIEFDDIDDTTGRWHHTIAERQKADPSFDPSGKRVFACIRRLPSWIVSMATFEATRNEHLVATREMIVRGRCFDGTYVNCADDYMDLFNMDVHHWIRTEYLAGDVAKAFDLPQADVADALLRYKSNVTPPYVRNTGFWFTDEDLDTLYSNNPLWASVEDRVYGGHTPSSLRQSLAGPVDAMNMTEQRMA
ncbi:MULTISPECIES: hypothetical protein [unclassified Mesorhizobium]|uniref:hypothetical protein n=1 Tax=unclassified Mesorhizobium TaxID=325217 RepID=UPI000FD4D96C|nr:MULTISPECIES: hypothetical protein [unclassified Mesorhizobium]RUX09709.1 hypothetical protein EOA30_02800 [Mesorhizobium sp. M8A.F.Ca.ET.059.01.1.1]RWC90063.1 MAG: hypothetical protein EOS72_09770 [Mesorhizobium sp.]TGT41343.1 hypothetical protein EN808_15785 [Mesorhizobium sp. M8A.F.Ca.ET.165.01.1.1]